METLTQFQKVLLTVTPYLDYSGSIPSEFVCRHLARHLIENGIEVRVLAITEQSKDWPEEVQIIHGSITSPSLTPFAFEGMDAIFFAGAIPETVYDAVGLAQEAGVKKLVNLSSHGPEIEIQFTPDSWHWLAIEVVLERSGINYTRIVPSNIMASTLVGDHYSSGKSWAERINNNKWIKEPYAHGKVSLIHEEDLALVIAKELQQQSSPSQKTLHVYGRPISPIERIEVLRQVLKKEIKFKELSSDEAIEYYRQQGMDEHAITHVLSVLESMSKKPVAMNPEIEEIMGRPLKTYAQWVEEHIAYFDNE